MVLTEILPLPGNLIARHKSALIIGKEGVCKTSFLFRFAYSMALKYQDRQVLFISPNRINKIPKLTFEGMPSVTSNAIKRIKMMYPKSFEELIDYLAKFFTLDLSPSAFVVDDLDEILNRRENSSQNIEQRKTYKECLSRLMALLVDNVHFLRVAKPPCDLLVATSYQDNGVEDFITIKTFGDHFFEQVYRIERELVLEPASSGFEMFTKDDLLKFRLLVIDDEVKLREIKRIKRIKKSSKKNEKER